MTVLPGAAVHLVPDAFLSPHVVQFQSGRQANRHRLQRVNFALVLRRPIETARRNQALRCAPDNKFCSMLFGDPYRLGGRSVNNSGIPGSRA
jgi:hypothetical protein